ncbi:MAG: undecaprenyldiphospho-muramoylpentapeptide beta-N-acetylglucosaminyltransferase [Elusimicrobia bacterium]|nr:undecaprenyldiphospho-muramoylpentapeptide beta-N-acetylglucosaminyltransferase [Candidatus Liberimonas magnetica]
MAQTETIIIAAGGTGGHIYPGIALARELKKRNIKPIFIVRSNDLGCKILDGEKLEYFQIPIIGLSRSLSLKVFKFILLFVISFIKSFMVMVSVKPKAVVGMGGYISGPVVLAAWLKGIKVVLHESNFIPGLANRFLMNFADKMAFGFEDTKIHFKEKKAFFTGNPVRLEIFNKRSDDVYSKYKLSKDKFTVLVFGGSQGAKNLNKNLVDSLHLMSEVKENVQFLHITGTNYVPGVKEEYEKNGFVSCVLPYLESIGEAYHMADLIICRSGASTVSELAILNKPTIFIPFPFATENHQEYNAKALADKLKAVMIREKDLKPEMLAAAIKFQLKSSYNRKERISLPSPLPQEKLADLVLN